MKQPYHLKVYLKAYFSILMIVSTLLFLVFVQMEERRLGYSVLHMTKEHRKMMELKQKKELMFTQLTRPQNVERLASLRRELKKVKPEQVIQLTASQIAELSEGDLR